MRRHRFPAPQAARLYVTNVMISMLESELTDNAGWMFGGVDKTMDRERVRQAIEREIGILKARLRRRDWEARSA